MQLFALPVRFTRMNDRQSLDRAQSHAGSDGHLDLGFAAKRADAIGACLRKSFQDDLDDDVSEELEKLLKALN